MKIFKRLTAAAVSAIMCFTANTGFTAFGAATPNKADYYAVDANWAKLLQYSMYFYDANMCGTEVSKNNLLSWRGNCHTYDSKVKLNDTATNLSSEFIAQNSAVLDSDGDGCVDVSGGFHDAGDHVKFGLPEAYAASVVSWGYYEFRDSYKTTGQDAHAETLCRYFCDYFMRSTFRDKNGKVIAFCYQVGDGDIDHAYWQAPEIDAMERPAYFATSDKPTTDDVSETAAALAINYYNFKDTDAKYAAKCLDYAKALFDFASENEKKVGAGADGPKSYYTSNKWEDDYCFAACWLYLITENHDYLAKSLKYVDYYAPPGYVLCWNDMWNGVSILLGKIQDIYPAVTEEYRTAAGRNPYERIDFWYMEAKAMNACMNADAGLNTPAGYFWINKWGSARYNTAAQFCALVYDKYQKGKDLYNTENKDYTFSKWALGQMEYLIGDNPINRCYVVGYGDNAAKYPHHRAASGLTKCEDTSPQKHVLYGALVGGPDDKDQHNDITKDWVYNEVTIDYNAAFVGACAGLYNFFGDKTMQPQKDFPPAEAQSDDTLISGNNYWVSGYCSDAPESTRAGVTKLTLFVNTDSLEAHTDISVRYYFDISEFKNNKSIPSSFVLQKTYDQVQTEVSGKEATLSKPIQYKDNIYYVEISWPGYAIANSNKKYQFIIGMYYGDNWDSSNDWSRKGITDIGDKYDNIVGGTEYAEKCNNICVYANGKLVGGTEPDGTVPQVQYTIAHLVRLRKAIVGISPFTSKETAQMFDINGDGNIDVFDETALRKIITK